MEYRYLRAFQLTAQHKSFSQAAEELHIAQSAVSRQIKLLEEQLGHELIIRSSKKVVLTQKGKELLLATQHFHQLTSEIFTQESRQPIRIGILNGLLKNWFIPHVVEYLKHDNRSMQIKIGERQDLKQGLLEGRFDVIFSTEHIQSELLSSLKLFTESFLLISQNEIDRRKLHQYNWIVYGPSDHLFELTKKQSSVIIEVDSISAILELVRQGQGIAVVPAHVLRKEEKLETYPLQNVSNSEIYMTTLNYKQWPKPLASLAKTVTSP